MEDSVFNTELGKKFLAITKASFRVADLIPDLVMREKIKAQSLHIYETFAREKREKLLEEINALRNLFFLAGHLNLVKEEHLKTLGNGFLVLESRVVLMLNNGSAKKVSFAKMGMSTSDVDVSTSDVDIAAEETGAVLTAASASAKGQTLNQRQEKILNYFQNKGGRAQLAQVMEIFPELSSKTIRNDLAYLCEIRKLKRQGWGNGSYYELLP